MNLELLNTKLKVTDNPGLDTLDPRFADIVTLIQESNFSGAAAQSQEIIEEEIYDIRIICYFLYGFMALPGGFLADKWGYKIVLIIFFFGTPAAACVVGAARSVLGLGIGLALLGLFASLYHPMQSVYI